MARELVPPPPPTAPSLGAGASMPDEFAALAQLDQQQSGGDEFAELARMDAPAQPVEPTPAPVEQPAPKPNKKGGFKVEPKPSAPVQPVPSASVAAAPQGPNLMNEAARGFQNQLTGVGQMIAQGGQDIANIKNVGDAGNAALAALAGVPLGAGQFAQDLTNAGVGALRSLGVQNVPTATFNDVAREFYEPVTSKAPGLAGAGEFAGGMVVPMAVPAIGALKGLPLAATVASGAATGALSGTVSDVGQQVGQGRFIPDVGLAAARGGVPAGAMGAVGGAALHGVGTGLRKLTSKGKTAAPVSSEGMMVRLPDGNAVTHTEALKMLESAQDPTVAQQLADAIADAQQREMLGLPDSVELETRAELAPLPEKAYALDESAEPRAEMTQEQREAVSQAPKVDEERLTAENKQVMDRLVADRQPSKEAGGLPVMSEEPPARAEDPGFRQKLQENEQVIQRLIAKGAPKEDLFDLLDSVYRQPETANPKGEDMFDALDREAANQPPVETPSALSPPPVSRPAPAPDQYKLPNVTLEDNTPSVTDGVTPPAAEPAGTPPGPRFAAESRGDGRAKRWHVVDTETGEILMTTKSKSQAEGSAEKRNAGNFKTGQGRRTDRERAREAEAHSPTPDIPPTATTYQRKVIESSPMMPDDAPPELRAQVEEIAKAKRKYDHAEAARNAAIDAFHAARDIKQPMRKGRGFSERREKFIRKAFAEFPEGQFNIEINSDSKPVVDPSIYSGKTPREIHAEVMRLHDIMQQADSEYRLARGTAADGLKKWMRESGNPAFNSTTPEGTVNVRVTANRGSEVDTQMLNMPEGRPDEADAYPSRDVRTTQKILRESEPSLLDKAWQAAEKALNPDEAVRVVEMSGRRKGGRSQRGAVMLFGGKPPGQKAATVSVARGAQKSEKISQLANDAKAVGAVFSLRRSLDVVADYSKDLHNTLWQNIGREAQAGRGVEFKPGDELLVERSLTMKPSEILQGKNGLNVLSMEQKSFLSQRQMAHQESAKAIRKAIEDLDKKHGSDVYKDLKTTRQTLKDLEAALTGNRQRGGTSEISDVADILSNAMYDYVFKWNPGYHALNMLDPLIFGSSRAGLQRVTIAKGMLATDANVRKYIKSFQVEGVVEDFRKESRSSEAPAGTFDDSGVLAKGYAAAKRGVKKLQSVVPDIPSIKWNNEDMIATGVILHGDKIKYKGGGVQLLKDMASGKVSKLVELEAIVEALKVNNDVNGSGTFGLDRDPVQRSGLRGLVQFTSQPYRVTRLLKRWVTDIPGERRVDALKSLATFFAMQYAFGGRAAIPREVEKAWEKADSTSLYAFQDILDIGHPRDLADKLRISIFPIMSGTQQNIAFAQLQDILNKAEKKPAEAVKAEIFFAISSLLGGGGGTLRRGYNEAEAATKGAKKVYSFKDDLVELPGQRPLGRRVRTGYGALDALRNLTLPGQDVSDAAFKINTSRRDNLRGTPALKNLKRRDEK